MQLNENDGLPKSICSECKTTIINWHEFWEQCARVDNNLKLKLTDSVSEEVSRFLPLYRCLIIGYFVIVVISVVDYNFFFNLRWVRTSSK